jgi:ABC-2 type transport system ATP-binding protein
MIQLDRVTKLYGSVLGVNDVSVSLTGAHGLLGPNGSGKSTLLNLITGQLRPTLGTVRVLDRVPSRDPEVFRRVGYCPEKDTLYANISGLDWVAYLMELHGFGRREASRRATEALERVGLGEAMRRRMGGYSRGMRQRTKLAQAIAHEPDLLILDEPLNGLDPVGRHDVTVLLREWASEGRGLVLASHILHEVEAVTHSFLLIYGGRLLASGSAAEVHSLLADVPDEIRIRCDDPARLARCLVEHGVVESLRFAPGKELVVGTRSSAAIYAGLPEWLEAAGVRVDQLQSSDDSLVAVFASLLRIHRGKS